MDGILEQWLSSVHKRLRYHGNRMHFAELLSFQKGQEY
jgi:hypothetical protein